MKTYLYACVLILLTSSAHAADWLPLPQSIKDLLPVTHKAELPPAQRVNVGIPKDRLVNAPAKSADILRLAPGKSQTVTLQRDAASVIVGNPAHASVFLDNSRLLVVVPRAPGATSFTVLDNQGQNILTQQIVVSEKDDSSYVRVTRICDSASGSACVPATTYYCPDNCVAVSVPVADVNATTQQAPMVQGAPVAETTTTTTTTTPAPATM